MTVQSSSNYLIDGQPDPTLALVRGETYIFDINASGHPFYIKTIPSTGSGNAYSNGVTGNGTTVGSLTFTVPMDAPDTLYYNCSIHGGMTGAINIADPPIREYAWGENVGWLNAAPNGNRVMVHFDGSTGYLSGYAWGENIGWICFPTNGNGGVSLNDSGTLSGYAWGENIGWISFPTNGNGGVSIDTATGEFSGHAWGENIGWISFPTNGNGGVRTLAFDTQAQGTPNWWLDGYKVAENFDEGDGVPAWKEYVADTDPKDSTNFFQVISVTTTGSTAEVEVWPTSPRRVYTLESSDHPADETSWSNVVGQVDVPGEGGQQKLDDSGVGNAGVRLYRVEVSVSP